MQPYGREPAPQQGVPGAPPVAADQPADPAYGPPTGPPTGPPSGPASGPPGNGQPAYGAPSGRAGEPAYGQPGNGQPGNGQPAYGQVPYGQPDYGARLGQPAYGQQPGDPAWDPAYGGRPPWGTPPAPGDRLRPTRRELTAAAVVVLAMSAVGLLAGFLWAQLAPRLEYRVVRPNLALPVVPEVEEFVAADGRFVVLTLVAGALAGALCWWSRRTRGPVILVALALGGLAGAIVAWRFGMLLGPGYQEADLQVVGRVIRQPLELGARAALVVEPIAAIVVYLLAAGFSARNDLGRSDQPDRDEVSSGSA